MIIERIHAYLANPKEIPDSILSEVGSLAKLAFMRQFGIKEESERNIRLSSIGQCLRKQTYTVLGYEQAGKEIDARGKMVFFQGDLAEMAIIQLAKASGCNILHSGNFQKTVQIECIEGHPDGILETELENYLVEVKSMSSYSFADFEKGEIDEGYIYQINAYLLALNLNKCIIVALNKDSGVLSESIVTSNEEIQKDIVQNIIRLKQYKKWAGEGIEKEKLLPWPKYEANEKGFYPWQCLYCAYHKHCRPNAEKVLVGKYYKLKEINDKQTPNP